MLRIGFYDKIIEDVVTTYNYPTVFPREKIRKIKGVHEDFNQVYETPSAIVVQKLSIERLVYFIFFWKDDKLYINVTYDGQKPYMVIKDDVSIEDGNTKKLWTSLRQLIDRQVGGYHKIAYTLIRKHTSTA